MITKKILSLLTLVLLLFLLIVSAFPDDGSDPDPDADPWNETVRRDEPLPDDEDASTIIIWVRAVSYPPFFIVSFDKVQVSPSQTAVAGPNSTHVRSSSTLSR